jgi:acylphosphatase
MNSTEKVCYSVFVSGRVQGVGYRYFVLEEAQKLDVHGWTRNLFDGRVESRLEGTEGIVLRLIERMREGPRLAGVESVQVEKLTELSNYTDFKVVRDA